MFAETLAAKDKYHTDTFASMRALDVQFQAVLEAAWKAANPGSRKRKRDYPKDLANYAELRAPFETQAETLRTDYNTIVDAFEESLKIAAGTEPLPRTPELSKVSQVDGGNYHTQGYGANKYARESAQQNVDKALFHGLKAEVREGESYTSGGRYSQTYTTYEVWADTTETGWTQLSYLPSVPLRDWLAMCWKRGVNPRVYNPFLPWNLEEKLGVDHFGNLVDPQPEIPLVKR